MARRRAVEGDAANAFVKDVAADGIINHIGAAAVGDFLDLFTKAAADIDNGVGVVLPSDHRQLLIGGGGGDHLHAETFAKIDGGQANPSGRAMDQKPLARSHLRPAHQGDVGGEISDWISGGFSERKPRRFWRQRALRQGDHLCEASKTRAAHDRISDLEATCAPRRPPRFRQRCPDLERRGAAVSSGSRRWSSEDQEN